MKIKENTKDKKKTILQSMQLRRNCMALTLNAQSVRWFLLTAIMISIYIIHRNRKIEIQLAAAIKPDALTGDEG